MDAAGLTRILQAAPDRAPLFISERDNKPDDAILFDLPLDGAPEARVRNRILVQNPEALYGFAKSA